jgi:predicted permease
MVKNYLKTAWRNLLRQKRYAFINVFGLAVGLASSFFILLWVMSEMGVDAFHESGDRIYRVMRNETNNDEVFTRISTAGPMGETLKKEYPEVENAACTAWGQDLVVTYGDLIFREYGNYAGAEFFEIFSFPFIQGDPIGALATESSIVISESLARKLFGTNWKKNNAALGETITIDQRKDFTITGVVRDVGDNSTIRFDVMLPIQDFFSRNEWAQQWGANGFLLYVRLKEGASVTDVNAKIAGVMEKYSPEEQGEVVFLQRFEEAYLYGKFEDGVNTGGRIDLVRILIVVAVFLLAIASINFMNLATARSTQRAREIGARKAIGATQQSLAVQLMVETMMLAFMAMIFATMLVFSLLPSFNTITSKHIQWQDISLAFLAGSFAISVITGLFAGTYPAFYLSSLNPVVVLRGTFRQKPVEARIRKALVVFQFALSTVIIICTVAVYSQIRYIMEKDLGLDRSHIISASLEGNMRTQYGTLRQELLNKPGILGVTSSSDNPLSIGRSTSGVVWEGKEPDDETEFNVINVNYDFVETMKMEVVSGRTHSREFGSDTEGYLINEQAARIIGKMNPVGKKLTLYGQPGQVIGLIKDFHMVSMERPISPTILRLDPANSVRLWVRTEPGKTREAISGLESVYKEINPNYPFRYGFMDREYEEMYQSVLVTGKLANVFAVIGILISCLGLFGLASFMGEQRNKEVGVRKVLGASVAGIVGLLSKEFVKLILIALTVATPVAYFAMQRWLHSFVYRIDITWWMFALAGGLTLLIAALTVSTQAIKAAVANPIESLRYE